MSADLRHEAEDHRQSLQRIFHSAVKVATKGAADETHGSLTLYWCTTLRQPRIDVTRVTDNGAVLSKYVPEAIESVHLHSGVERDGPTAILTITESGSAHAIEVTHLSEEAAAAAGIPASSVVDRVVWMKMSRRMTMDFVRYWCDHASPPPAAAASGAGSGSGLGAEGPVLVMYAMRGKWPIVWHEEDPAAKARRRAGGRDYDEGGGGGDQGGSEMPGSGSGGRARAGGGMHRGQGGGPESSVGPRGGAGTPSALSGTSSAYRAFAGLGQGRYVGSGAAGPDVGAGGPGASAAGGSGYDRFSPRQGEGGRGWAATSASGRSATSRVFSLTEQPVGPPMRAGGSGAGQAETARALDELIQRQTAQLAQLQLQTQQYQQGMPASSPHHMQPRSSPAQWIDPSSGAPMPVAGMGMGMGMGGSSLGGSMAGAMAGMPIMVHPGMAFMIPNGAPYAPAPSSMGISMYSAYPQQAGQGGMYAPAGYGPQTPPGGQGQG